jgi:oligopeptidase A
VVRRHGRKHTCTCVCTFIHSVRAGLLMLAYCCCSAAVRPAPQCREVETLFHEFGHALQHMMTTVDEGLVAGIR